jgi:IS30 family transposase
VRIYGIPDIELEEIIMSNAKHLTRDDRVAIEEGLSLGLSKSQIANRIDKDKSTVGKEIKAHRIMVKSNKLSLDCADYKKCPYGRQCPSDCDLYVPFACARRDRKPGACNGCPDWHRCRHIKYKYSADLAQKEYEYTLRDSREGVDLTAQEASVLAGLLKDGLSRGLSIAQILTEHTEIKQCEKTIYTYIEDGILKAFNVSAMDLRKQVSRKRRMSEKDKVKYKKRKDRKYLIGRTYTDFEDYMKDHPDAHAVEMDTVYNDVTNGPFIQTFFFRSYKLLIALYHEEKTAAAMAHGVAVLKDILGEELFLHECEVLLTDRGSEFVSADTYEKLGTHIFYCDPMASWQKPFVENSHHYVRYFFQKEKNMRAIGLTGQQPLNLAISHILSSTRESLDGKRPVDIVKFLSPLLWERMKKFGLKEIPYSDLNLSPTLFIKK